MKYQYPLFILIFLLFASCNIISFSPSPSLKEHPAVIRVHDDCNFCSTGAVTMNVAGIIKKNFLPAGIRINYKDIIIYIDPLAVKDSVKADYIFITHNHADHFSKNDVKKLSDQNTQIIGPKNISRKLKKYNFKKVSVNDSFAMLPLKCKVVPSYNLKKNYFQCLYIKKGIFF